VHLPTLSAKGRDRASTERSWEISAFHNSLDVAFEIKADCVYSKSLKSRAVPFYHLVPASP
jgi:hypothetical protein